MPKKTVQREGESHYEYAQRGLQARIERSTKVRHEDETGGDMVVIEYSEKHLHEGHEWEVSEVLRDNPVEGTAWAYCQTCFRNGDDPEFWAWSIEMESGF